MSDVFCKEKIDLDSDLQERIRAIKEKAEELNALIGLDARPCRESALAVTKLEEVVMWAVKGIVVCCAKPKPTTQDSAAVETPAAE